MADFFVYLVYGFAGFSVFFVLYTIFRGAWTTPAKTSNPIMRPNAMILSNRGMAWPTSMSRISNNCAIVRFDNGSDSWVQEVHKDDLFMIDPLQILVGDGSPVIGHVSLLDSKNKDKLLDKVSQYKEIASNEIRLRRDAEFNTHRRVKDTVEQVSEVLRSQRRVGGMGNRYDGEDL